MSAPPYETLESELRALSAEIDFPPTPDLAGAVAAQLRARPSVSKRAARWWASPRTSAIAAAIVALLAAVLVLSPDAREAVADIFRGVRGIRIVVDDGRPENSPTPTATGQTTSPATVVPTTPAPSDSASSPEESATSLPPAPVLPGVETALAEVSKSVAFTPLVPAALGAPDQVLFEKDVAGGMVTMVWKATADLPPAAGDIGAVLTQFRPAGGDNFPYWMKGVETEGSLRFVQVNGTDGTWVEGGHRLDFRIPDPAGSAVTSSSRIAANTLVWVQNGITIRLETALTLGQALELAESMQ